MDDKSFNGAAKKLEEVCQYHVGDTCHSLSRVSLQPGGTECLVYTTMLGAVGAFVPFTSREDGALQPQSRRAVASLVRQRTPECVVISIGELPASQPIEVIEIIGSDAAVPETETPMEMAA